MHIVVNARFLTQNISGVQRFAIEICLRLKQQIDDIEFVSPDNILQHDIAQLLNAKIIGKRHGHLWEQLDLPTYLRHNGKPLLINLANTAPLFYNNKIVTIHDTAYKVFPRTYPKSFLLFYNFMIPQILRNSKHVFTVSKYSKAEICKYYQIPKEKISVIYNATSNIFKPTPTDSSIKYFLAVSSLNYRKNFIYILNAFSLYQAQGGKGYIYIIGDLKNKSFKEIDLTSYKTNKYIKFLGRVSDTELVKYYSNALAFIYPSLYEGFGIPPLEAQACGCPVICANTSCLPEIFGDSVLYCDPYNIETLKELMLKIYEDEKLRNNLIKNGFRNKEKYYWEKSANQIISIINTLYHK